MPGRLTTMDGREREYDRQLGDLSQAGLIPCFRCGVCCERWQPLLGRAEAARIARRLGLDIDSFLTEYARPYPLREETWQLKNLVVERGEPNGRACVFLHYDDDGLTSCSIYEDRPDACRVWLAALSRKECRDGLSRIGSKSQVLLPADLPLEGEESWEMLKTLRKANPL